MNIHRALLICLAGIMAACGEEPASLTDSGVDLGTIDLGSTLDAAVQNDMSQTPDASTLTDLGTDSGPAMDAGSSGADSGSGATDAGSGPIDAAPSATMASCRSWLASHTGASLAPLTGMAATQRSNLLASGSGLETIGDTYFSVTVPDGFFTAENQKLVVSLHGTGGYPEAEWTDWHSAMESAGYAFVSLLWYVPTRPAGMERTTDAALYTQIQDVLTLLRGPCPVGDAQVVLMGFSVGSAVTFPLAVRDHAMSNYFSGFVMISGAAWNPMSTGMTYHPYVEAVRTSTTALDGEAFWMFCGGTDTDHGWAMCDEMTNAQTFVTGRGGMAELQTNPSGGHHSLSSTPSLVDDMVAFIGAL